MSVPNIRHPFEQHAGREPASGRLLALKIIFVVFFAVVVGRLVQIQVLDSARYRDIARKQSEVKVALPAARGNIFDRNGTLLVSNSMMASIAADPKMIGDDAEEIAARLARVFDHPRRYYMNRMDEDRHFVWLERRVKPQLVRQIGIADFPGAMQLDEPRRLYHYDQVGGQLIGCTDVDNNGVSGIELQYNSALTGRDGYMVMQRDALGRRRNSVDCPRLDPVNGKDVVLTLDLRFQAIAEEELRKGIQKTGAKSGLVLMLDPSTGEVLAMVNVPGADPNDPASAAGTATKNRCITDMFEPGSVFKVVTAAAALEQHLVAPGQKFNAEHGRYVVPLAGGRKHVITDTHAHDVLTFQEAVEQSSNIVMAKVSNTIGAERLYAMARNFGFGNETGVDLPGEIRGALKKPTEWSGTTLNTMAYGYEVGVTPIQIACAYAAVANNGVLMKPFVVRRVIDEEGNILSDAAPQAVRTVVSKETARTLTTFFEGVIQHGTGAEARFPGTTIAGKTGTSRKVIEGEYEQGSYTASFVGFFPAEKPRVVCLVMLDNPSLGGYTGGMTSAPIFHNIAQKIFATLGSSPRLDVAGNTPGECIVPDVSLQTVEAARAVLAGQGFGVKLEGNGGLVHKQVPAAGKAIIKGGEVTLMTAGSPAVDQPGYAVVPDVRGLSMRKAMNTVAAEQLSADITGSGIVTAQAPLPGTQVRTGMRVTLRCEPRLLPVVN